MEENINSYSKIIGSAVIVIKAIQKEDNMVEFEFTNLKKNVPNEVIILQLKRFLKNLKKEYYNQS